MKYVASLLVILGLVAGASWADPPALTVAEVLARSKAAQGGAAWDAVQALRSSGELEMSGMRGTFESLEDARTGAWADRFDLGALRGANGFDGASAWSQDASGSPASRAARRRKPPRSARPTAARARSGTPTAGPRR